MWSSHLIDNSSGRTSLEAELSLSGVEGEWKLKGEEERARREFAMREWGEDSCGGSISEGGQWRLQEAGGDRTWPDKMEDEDPLAGEGSAEQKKGERRVCCCEQVTEIKIFITVFAIINLGIMAAGGVGFGLGLTLQTNGEDTFKYLMIGSSCLMCWGLLATTMDILALLGIYKGKKNLVLPWLLWYVLEMATYSAVVIVFVVFTHTFYILPLLLKTLLTVITWINVKRIYNNSFGTFYTKSTEAIIY